MVRPRKLIMFALLAAVFVQCGMRLEECEQLSGAAKLTCEEEGNSVALQTFGMLFALFVGNLAYMFIDTRRSLKKAAQAPPSIRDAQGAPLDVGAIVQDSQGNQGRVTAVQDAFLEVRDSKGAIWRWIPALAVVSYGKAKDPSLRKLPEAGDRVDTWLTITTDGGKKLGPTTGLVVTQVVPQSIEVETKDGETGTVQALAVQLVQTSTGDRKCPRCANIANFSSGACASCGYQLKPYDV